MVEMVGFDDSCGEWLEKFEDFSEQCCQMINRWIELS